MPIPVTIILLYKGVTNHPPVAKGGDGNALRARRKQIDCYSHSGTVYSSFETQSPPFSALQLQHSLREPVSLVSAYDLRREGDKFAELCREFRKTSVLLLDSGGYEHSHATRYSGDGAPTWTFDDFRTICGLALYDYVFSFDYFWREQNNAERPADFTTRLQDRIFAGHDFVPADRLIPVLHLHAHGNDNQRLSEDEILSLVAAIGSQCLSPFVAIPERELGDGLLNKYRLAKRICDVLTAQDREIGLHILGCGNLLSFAYFAVAGAKLVDGLEW